MSSLNQVQLIGNLGADPDIRYSQAGNRIATFSMATTEKWTVKDTGEIKEKTEWHRVVVFSEGLAGVVEKFAGKGSRVFVQGRLQTEKWTDDAGVERWFTKVVLSAFGGKLVLLGDAGGGGGREPEPSSAREPENTDLDDEIPF